MSNKKLKWALPSLGLVLAGSNALAQQSVIDHCKKATSDADRITCLEAALIGKELPTAPESQSQIDPPSMDVEAGPADTAAEPAVATEAGVVGIGADQVIARNQTREEQLESLEKASGLPVAKYEVVPYEKLLVTLENGQVWRQIKGDTQKIRVDLKRNQTVDIEESSFSGYKMHLNEMRRSIRVERVQ